MKQQIEASQAPVQRREFSPYRRFKCACIASGIAIWRKVPVLAFFRSKHAHVSAFAEDVAAVSGRSIKRGLAVLQISSLIDTSTIRSYGSYLYDAQRYRRAARDAA
jgi:hypothetical protein